MAGFLITKIPNCRDGHNYIFRLQHLFYITALNRRAFNLWLDFIFRSIFSFLRRNLSGKNVRIAAINYFFWFQSDCIPMKLLFSKCVKNKLKLPIDTLYGIQGGNYVCHKCLYFNKYKYNSSFSYLLRIWVSWKRLLQNSSTALEAAWINSVRR